MTDGMIFMLTDHPGDAGEGVGEVDRGGVEKDAVRLALEAGLAKLTGGDKATAGNALELTQHLTQ